MSVTRSATMPGLPRYIGLLREMVLADIGQETMPVAAALARRAATGDTSVVKAPQLEAVCDGFGHRRAHYPGLLAYATVRAGGDAGVLFDRLDDRSGSEDWPTNGMPASRDGDALRLAMDHLALAAAGRQQRRAQTTFERIAAAGGLLVDDGANPEPRWYAELVMVHALASYAAVSGAAELRDAAAAIARYHQAETQPDHATGQPWAVHAALLSAETFPLADLLLLPTSLPHAGSATAGPSGITRIVLADALLALETPGFLPTSP